MQHKQLTILLNGLIVLSLLLPSLPAQAGTSTPEQPPTQTVEASPTSAPLLTPSPEPYPTPEPIPATPYPTPTVVATTTIGNTFEWSGSTATMKTYYAGGTRLAMRTGSTLNWLLGDHLGSTTITANDSAIQVAKLLYKPWGEERFSSGTTPTTFKFTGQRQESSFGLYLYGSRWFDPSLGRFISPDPIVPGTGEGGDPNAVGYLGISTYSPLTVDYHENQLLEQQNYENSARLQDLDFRLTPIPTNSTVFDRYAYSLNNPIRYVDPSGHFVILAALALITPVGWAAIGLGVGSALVIYAVGPENIAESLVNVGEQVGETVNETAIGLAAIGLYQKRENSHM